MKVLLVITKSNWGGAQAYVKALATALARGDAEVAVALGGDGAADGAPGALAEALAKDGIRTIFIKSFMRDISLFREVKAFFELLRVIVRERPHVLHMSSSKAGGIGALAGRLARVPRIVFTSHGLAYDESRARFARALIALATWATFLLSHRVIVLSVDTERRARSLPFCRSKITLIYNGLAPVSYRARASARAALLLPENGFCIGTIAELTGNKALSSLIEAAALLKKRRCSFTLFIIGEGEEREKLEALIRARHLENIVRLAGFVPEAATYLKAFDIFTLVSVKEGLPSVLLEAGTAGCAVVGSAISGITDIIQNEVSGLLVAPMQSVAIADALERLMQNKQLQTTLGTKLKENISHTFSQGAMLSATFSCYTKK